MGSLQVSNILNGCGCIINFVAMFNSLTLPHCNDYLLKLFRARSLAGFRTILPRKFPHLFFPDHRTNEEMRADLLTVLLLAFGAPYLPLLRSSVSRNTRLSLSR